MSLSFPNLNPKALPFLEEGLLQRNGSAVTCLHTCVKEGPSGLESGRARELKWGYSQSERNKSSPRKILPHPSVFQSFGPHFWIGSTHAGSGAHCQIPRRPGGAQ